MVQECLIEMVLIIFKKKYFLAEIQLFENRQSRKGTTNGRGKWF
jgi:hypothetical protein